MRGNLPAAHLVNEMRDATAFDDCRVVEHHGWMSEVAEESHAVAEKNGREIDVEFVDDSGVETLLDDVGSRDTDRLLAGDGLCLRDRILDTVEDDCDRRVVAWPAFWRAVGDEEDGNANRMPAT